MTTKMKSLATNIGLRFSVLALIVFSAGCHHAVKKSPTESLKDMAYGHLLARAIHQIAYFRVGDEVDGKTPVEDIAKKLKLDSDSLNRVLRVLINHGIFTQNDNGMIDHTPLSLPLKSAAESSLRAAFAKESDKHRWDSIGAIDIALKTGRSPFYALYGEGFYDYLNNNPEAAALFNEGMSGFSEREDRSIAQEFDFSPYNNIYDIGGGTGGLLSAILNKNPKARATLFDLKDAVEKSPVLNDPALKGRVNGKVGDFFSAIPAGGALYILKRVIHNWDDERSIEILKNVRQAIGNSHAPLLVIEKILPEKPDGSLLVDTDLIALSFGEGRERNQAEFRRLAQKAGFSLAEILPTSAGVSVMVFRPK